MDRAHQELLTEENAYEAKVKELIETLKNLTESSVLRWENTANFGPRAYRTEFNGVHFELRVNNQTLCFDLSEFVDTQGLLDELVWAVEGQLAPPNRKTFRIPSPQDELQSVLDKLNAQ